MGSNTMQYVIIGGFVLFVLIVRFLINSVFNKAENAITNKYRQYKNEKSGPSVEKLADIFDPYGREKSRSNGNTYGYGSSLGSYNRTTGSSETPSLHNALMNMKTEEAIKQGGWYCFKCNRLNYSYVSTCACGTTQADSKELRAQHEKEMLELKTAHGMLTEEEKNETVIPTPENNIDENNTTPEQKAEDLNAWRCNNCGFENAAGVRCCKNCGAIKQIAGYTVLTNEKNCIADSVSNEHVPAETNSIEQPIPTAISEQPQMYCFKCGAAIDPDDRFCYICGSKLN